jgi:putative ABC transport system permease protein
VAPEVRRAVASVDPELAPHAVQPLTAVLSGSWVRHRFDAVLFGAFAAGALLLAASGIFAVLSYEVARRTRELGIRVAVGANPARIVRDVLRVGMAYPLAGLAVGVAAALATTRLLESSLYEISPQEPRVFAGTVVVLVAVAVAACLVPAWRATRVNPLDALRAE